MVIPVTKNTAEKEDQFRIKARLHKQLLITDFLVETHLIFKSLTHLFYN